MQLPVYNINGEVTSHIEVPDVVFGIEPNVAVMHQGLVRQQANARTGTHDTRTRAEVSGGGKKPWRQKGTGRARQGSIRAPQWRGGGIVFGPHPRSYKQQMPRKMRRLAVRSALSQKLLEQKLRVLTGLSEMEPRTKVMIGVLDTVRGGPGSTLIATNGRNETAYRAGNNIPGVKFIHAMNMGVADLLKFDYLVLEDTAIEPLVQNLSKEVTQPAESASEAAFVLTPRAEAVEDES